MFGNDKNNKLNKYGRVVEDEDKIIVYVKQGVVYKYSGKLLSCEEFDNGKKIYYVFENIIFPDRTYINGTNANLIFINCTFNQIIKIEKANSIQMQNNKYYFYGFADNCIELIGGEILLKDNDFTNASPVKNYDEPNVNITLIGDKLIVENSIIHSEYAGNINIMAQHLSLDESTINSKNIYINADNISTKKSIIVAPKEIRIDNENCNFTCTVKSPIIIYNDIKLSSLNSQIIDMNEEKAKLLKARIRLIDTLRTVEDNCLQENSIVLTDIQRRLKNRKICKVLKADK